MAIQFVPIEGVFSSDRAKPGMAYFEGTGPSGKKCGDCKRRGYMRRSTRDENRLYRVQGCEKFKSLSGRHGPAVDKDWRACKYFEQREKDK